MLARTLAAVALFAASVAAAPIPAPPKLTDEQAAEFDKLWDACRFNAGDRAHLDLRLIAEPAAATEYLTAKLPPMAMTEEEAKKLLADLDSEDAKVWKKAYRALTVRDIRLAMTPQAAWELVTGDKQRMRFGGLLFGYAGPDDFPAENIGYELQAVPKQPNYLYINERWNRPGGDENRIAYITYAAEMKSKSYHPTTTRARIAVAALERIGTPAAKKHLQALTEGHEKGPATVEAKAALDRLKADPPKPTPPADLWKGDREAWGKPATINHLLAQPKEAVAFLKDKLRPLTLTEKEAKALLAKLFSDDAKEWKAAVAELDTFDLRLAMSVQDAWKLAESATARGRLKRVFADLSNQPTDAEKDGFDIDAGNAGKDYTLLPPSKDYPQWNFCPFPQAGKPPKGVGESGGWGFFDTLTDATLADRWQREAAAVRVLDAIGTDDALAVVKAMATGHKDAGPTKVAKEVLKRRGVK